MKLRQLVANSLPRVRGRKKKQQNSAVLNNEQYYDRNSNQLQDPISDNKDIPILKNVASVLDVNDAYTKDRLDRSYYADNLDSLNCNVNTDLVPKCGCCQHEASYYNTDEGEKRDINHYFSDSDEKVFNTIPKGRSKIKTNPWLPSPKTPRSQLSLSSESSTSSSVSSTGSSPVSPSADMKQAFHYQGTDSPMTISSESVEVDGDQMVPSAVLVKFSYGHDEQIVSPILGVNRSLDHQFSMQACIGEDTHLNAMTSCYEVPAMTSCYDNSTPKHDISFEYEDTLDSLLESGPMQREETCLSIQDLLTDDSGSCEKLTEGYSKLDGSLENVDAGFDDLSSDEGTIDLRCHDDKAWPMEPQDSTDTGYSSLSNEGQSEIDIDFQYFSTIPFTPRITKVSKETFHDKLTDVSPVKEVPARILPKATGRSLGEVRTSLEEKVYQLRQEKFIVERKIKEAQEEERIRKQEKLKFQKQLTLHRKQILVKTLHDLKSKLENQADRLQNNYNAVLKIQRRFAQRRSPLKLLTTASGM